MTKNNRIVATVLAGTLLLACVIVVFYNSLVATREHAASAIVTKTLSPAPIMSTPQFNIIAVGLAEKINVALAQAEQAARLVEKRMNIFNPASELSKFNAAASDIYIPLSPETTKALTISKQAYDDTAGAFDVTLRPVIMLWKNGFKTNTLPTADQLAAARKSSSWADFKFSCDGIKKKKISDCVDLGGIAKGYANDLAIDALKNAGCSAGLVDIGGGIACFGRKKDGGEWTVGVRDPFEPHSGKMLVTLRLTDAGVCTSGNYERAGIIQGKTYNHIIDPRTLMPTDACLSATIIAPTAAQADAWATALCVLGPDGLKKLPQNGTIHAMLITGSKDNFKIITSPDFSKFVEDWGIAKEHIAK